MSSKEYCESGKHSYVEVDVVVSIFATVLDGTQAYDKASIVVACSKCDSKFLRDVVRPLP